jgi:hypothetical protein
MNVWSVAITHLATLSLSVRLLLFATSVLLEKFWLAADGELYCTCEFLLATAKFMPLRGATNCLAESP